MPAQLDRCLGCRNCTNFGSPYFLPKRIPQTTWSKQRMMTKSFYIFLKILLCWAAFSLLGNVPLAIAQDPLVLVTSLNDSLDNEIEEFLKGNYIRTIDDYAKWLSGHMLYQSDATGDRWAEPEETLKRRSGDCEDLAFLHKEVLRILGYRARVFAFGKTYKSHAICVFKKDGHYYIFDNIQLNKTKATSFLDIAYYMYTKQNSSFFSEINLNPKKVSVFYFKKPNAG